MKKVKVAIIGYGHLGKWHADKAWALKDQCDLIAVVEKNPDAQKNAREKFPSVKVVSDVGEIISEIEAAIVVTPTSFHYEIVEYLLKEKKHVFCEKPLCSTEAQARSLEELAVKNHLVLQVGHSERCHEAWEKLIPALAEIKGPMVIKIERVAAFKGRATDVDVVQDLMIHDLDLVSYLTKKLPTRIRAKGFKIRTQYWDHVEAELDYADGSVARITSSRNHVKEKRELEIMSAQGCYAVDMFALKYSYAPSTQITDGVFVQESPYSKRDHLLIEHQYFYDSINHGKPIFVDGKAGRMGVGMVDAVLSSIDRNAWVEFRG